MTAHSLRVLAVEVICICLSWLQWDKPDEFARYEQELEKRRKQQSDGKDFTPIAPDFSTQQIAQGQSPSLQNTLLSQELKHHVSALVRGTF